LRRYLRLARQLIFSRGTGPGMGAIQAANSLLKAMLAGLVSFPAQMAWRKKWLKTRPQRAALFRLIKENMLALKEISRLD